MSDFPTTNYTIELWKSPIGPLNHLFWVLRAPGTAAADGIISSGRIIDQINGGPLKADGTLESASSFGIFPTGVVSQSSQDKTIGFHDDYNICFVGKCRNYFGQKIISD